MIRDVHRNLREKMLGKRRIRGTPSCPDAELLGAYLEGRTDPAVMEQIRGHLVHCPECLDLAAVHVSLSAEGAPPEPTPSLRPEAVRLAQELFGTGGRKQREWDLVVRFFQGALEVLCTTLTPPRAVPCHASLRGTGDPAETGPTAGPIRLEKSFEGIVVEIEVGDPREGGWSLQAMLRPDRGERLPEGLRVSLIDATQDKVLESVPVCRGVAAFQDCPSGEFLLEVRSRGTVLGTLGLCLSGT